MAQISSNPPPAIRVVKRDRKLQNDNEVFNENAWDDTEWTNEMVEEAERRLQQQKDDCYDSVDANPDRISDVESKSIEKWNQFYATHKDKFFKDRRWIFSEFPEISARIERDQPPCRILEVGCGVGNAVAWIINSNQNPNLHVYCCDLSHSAIETLKEREFYLHNWNKITAFQGDISNADDSTMSEQVERESIDFITIIFTLSALKPELMQLTIDRLTSFLKPGGMILFRDYARYDLAQLRFKGKSLLNENYYVRADGTTSYFFTKQLVQDLFKNSGLTEIEFKEDNRMLVNRLKSLKMFRRWVQAKYKKPD